MKRLLPRWIWPVILVMAIATVSVRLFIVKTSYSVHEAQSRIRTLKQQREQLEMRSAQLRSPRRLEGLARQRQMEPARPEQIIRVSQAQAKEP